MEEHCALHNLQYLFFSSSSPLKPQQQCIAQLFIIIVYFWENNTNVCNPCLPHAHWHNPATVYSLLAGKLSSACVYVIPHLSVTSNFSIFVYQFISLFVCLHFLSFSAYKSCCCWCCFHIVVLTTSKEVRFLVAYVYICVCLSAGYHSKIFFYTFWWNLRPWAMEQVIRFWGALHDHVGIYKASYTFTYNSVLRDIEAKLCFPRFGWFKINILLF